MSTLFRSPLTTLSPQLESWLGSLSRSIDRHNAARCQAETFLEDGAYIPVRREAGDLAIVPPLEDVFRRDRVDIVHRPLTQPERRRFMFLPRS